MKISKLLLIVTIFSVFLVSCNDDNPDPVEKSKIVTIQSNITEPATWYADSVYIIKAWDFYVSNTLTIEPGTIIKFHSDGPDLTLGSGGTINAVGTVDKPIIFTSWKDDDHGGDTNGDEGQTTPGRKDWGGINTNDNNGSIFTYCEFYYGGGSSYSSTLKMYGDNILVNNCTFAHNAGDDGTGWYGVLDANYGESGCIITNNVFYDNVRPLSVSLLFNIDNSNAFVNPENQDDGNTYNGIFVTTIDELNDPISWLETEVPFVIDDNDWWINSGASLTLGDNVCLKFRPGSVLLLEDGGTIVNYDGTGVFFTSYKDDTRKGDTNGDGDATLPATGDWGGIYDDLGGSYASWANILYSSN